VPDKPSVLELGLELDAQVWRRSGSEAGAVEVAFAGPWVLMRVAGDPTGRVLVYDHHEWRCFLDGVNNGEFDDLGLERTPPSQPSPSRTSSR
jgi:hypothetical protein